MLFMEGMKPPFYPLYTKLKEHLPGNGSHWACRLCKRAGSAVMLIARPTIQIIAYELDWGQH